MSCTVEVKTNIRPCVVGLGNRKVKALFHKWSPNNGNNYEYALVEFENGCVSKIHPDTLQFLDSDLYFSEINWGDEFDEN